MVAFQLTDPPERAFWLGELRIPDFDELELLLEDQGELAWRLEREFPTPAMQKLLVSNLEVLGDTAEVRVNLLLAVRFLRHKKSQALLDASAAALPADVLDGLRTPGGRLHRMPALMALIREDLAHLVVVDMCHRWHSRNRCAMKLDGPRRKLPSPMADLGWLDIAQAAFDDVRGIAAHPSPESGGTRCLAMPRVGGVEMLLAFREPVDRGTVRVRAGAVVPGFLDDWTILRFHENARRVDVTARNADVGIAFAAAVARCIWGKPLSYSPAAAPLRAEDLNKLLWRLTDLENDVFRLLEITAELPGDVDRPIMTLGNPGQTRVERSVQRVRRTMAFALDWRTVHRVKVAFDDHYRIVLHFPLPDGDLVLSYSDRDRDKDVCTRFEALVAKELGAEIHPKAARKAPRRPKFARKPRKLGPRAYAALLRPVIDDPAPWQIEILERLEVDGLVHLTHHSVFRCGDARLERRAVGLDTLDCDGVVELPFGHVTPDDPFQQEDDAQVVCSSCGHPWYPERYRLPMARRVRVEVDIDEAWSHVVDVAAGLFRVEIDRKGVASGMYRGMRVQLVFLPAVDEHPWHNPACFGLLPVAWISLPGDERLRRYRQRAVDLADVLAKGRATIARVLDLGVDATPGPDFQPSVAETQPPYGAQGEGLPLFPDSKPTSPPGSTPVRAPARQIISLDETGVWMHGRKIARRNARGIISLLRMLAQGAALDGPRPGDRRFRSAKQLANQNDGGDAHYSQVQRWISRTREAITRVFPEEVNLAVLVIEGGKGGGYRLGPTFDVVVTEPAEN